ncbi:MAG: O-methyltransferase [archaeon]
MIDILPAHSESFVRALGPQPDAVVEEMEALAAERGDRFPGEEAFPTVGPAVGAWLQLLAELTGAERVFEFGSGFGYSAYWLARGLGDGEIVLTEVDRDELDLAREFLARGDFEATIHFEHGDALEIVDAYDGPFDLVVLDHKNDAYPAAFEAVRGKLAPGGVLVADNVMTAAIIQTEALLSGLESGELPPGTNDHTRGVYEYLTAVRDDPAVTTGVLPVGGGVAVSRRA